MLFSWLRPRPNLEHARKLVEEGATLLDVRTLGEYEAGHVAGAKNIPVQSLPNRIAELGDPTKPVVVYCRSGARSATAAKILERHGFQTVVDVGPMPPW